jgi:hypothetical protein
MRDEVTGDLRKQRNPEFHDIYSWPTVNEVIKSRSKNGQLAYFSYTRSAYKILAGNSEGKRPLGRNGRR